MPAVMAYNREQAVLYAKRWALGRNPAYGDFTDLGGDCTNFVSQCLFAGSGVMNYTPTFGWYYNSMQSRAPAWTAVQYLYNFLTTNRSRAVFGYETSVENVQIGDVVQLGDENGTFYHTVFVTRTGAMPAVSNIAVCAHSQDVYQKPLRFYAFARVRFLHIAGYYAGG